MKKLFTILMLIPVILFGQNEPNTKIDLSKKNIYGELHVGLFSQGVMNYERQIFSGKTVSWYGRLGERLWSMGRMGRRFWMGWFWGN